MVFWPEQFQLVWKESIKKFFEKACLAHSPTAPNEQNLALSHATVPLNDL
jgi:hypothetical protein